MSYAEKKIESYSDNSLQIITTNYMNDSIGEKIDDFIFELSLEKRKQAASKPLYIKRI